MHWNTVAENLLSQRCPGPAQTMTVLSSKNDLAPGNLNRNIHEEWNKILGLEKSQTAQQIENPR
jgi:hypothetical protein